MKLNSVFKFKKGQDIKFFVFDIFIEIYFKGTPKLIHFYRKFHLVNPNENLPQN